MAATSDASGLHVFCSDDCRAQFAERHPLKRPRHVDSDDGDESDSDVRSVSTDDEDDELAHDDGEEEEEEESDAQGGQRAPSALDFVTKSNVRKEVAAVINEIKCFRETSLHHEISGLQEQMGREGSSSATN